MEQSLIKNKVGRRLGYKGVNNKTDNPQYFNEYYHKMNHLVKCSCGQDIFSRSLRVHKTSKRHDKLIDLLKLKVGEKVEEIL